VPTYNEAAALGPLLDALEAELAGAPGVDASVLVIDDNSPDGTGDLAERLACDGSYPHLAISVLHRPAKEGLGRAYVDGLSHLLARPDVDVVLQMDADLSHHPRHLPAMLERIREADMVVGSRYIPGGATPDWKWYRRLVSRAGNSYARVLLGSRITDYTGGFNLYRAPLLRTVALESLRADGYGFLIELKHAAAEASGTVAEVPIVFMDRRVGASKIPRNTIAKNLVLVPQIRLRGRTSTAAPPALHRQALARRRT
jgi:dolichol-phosphate mannosyltransferase